MITALDVSRSLCLLRQEIAPGRPTTITDLLPLAYLAQGWHLEITGFPLFREKIEAWGAGPVVPHLVRSVPRNTDGVVNFPLQSLPDSVSRREKGFLEEILAIYGAKSGAHLSEIVREKGGPWDLVYRHRGRFSPIPHDLMTAHFRAKRAAAKRAA